MWVFTVISEERVPPSFKELLLGVLFLLIKEKILSSPALEWGIVMTASATWKSRSNSKEFVPGYFTSRKNPREHLHGKGLLHQDLLVPLPLWECQLQKIVDNSKIAHLVDQYSLLKTYHDTSK